MMGTFLASHSRLSAALLATAALSQSLGAVARPVVERTPLEVDVGAGPAIHVEGVDLARYRTPDLRRVEHELLGLVTEALREQGYAVGAVGQSESAAISQPAASPETSLSGEVYSYDCTEREGGTCAIAVQWELRHTASGAVLYRVITRHEETDSSALGKGEAARVLFAGAVRSLLSRAQFAARASAPPDGFARRLSPATLRACPEAQLHMPADAEKVLNATAVVRTRDGVGSAVTVSPDGYLLTAAHVVAGSEKREVTLIPRGGKELRARVVRYDENSDVALLKSLDGPATSACLELSSDGAKAGEDVYVVGAPGGEELSFSLSRGILSGKRRLHDNEYLQTDASINPGNSGGPLLDGSARVLGIVSWKLSGTALEGLGFAVEINSALSSLGLAIESQTSAELSVERAGKNVLAKPFVDEPDGDWQIVGAGAEPGAGLSPQIDWAAPLWGGGLFAVTTGAAVVSLSAALYQGGTDRDSYFTARTFNDVGWVMGGAGVLAIGAALLVPALRGGKSRTQSSALSQGAPALQVRPVVSLTHLGLNVSY